MSRTRTVALLSVSALAAASLLSVADPASAATTATPTDTTITTGEARTATPAAATAADGSIVYIHGFNVWLSRPDGSGQRAVTVDGTEASPYEHPTMSDGGVIAVMKGETIVRMGQDGAVYNRINPEDLFVPDYDTVHISPVQGAEISPDGTKIAYSQLRLERYGNGGWFETEAATSFTDAAQWVGPDKYGIMLGYQPGWVTNSRVALNRDGDVHMGDLGHDAQAWFFSDDIFGQFVELVEPEVSRDGKRVLFGVSGAGFAMKTAVGDPRTGTPAKPLANPECYITPEQGQPAAIDATFGPDSDSAVYSEGGDLWVARGLAACSAAGTTLTKIATGGTEPDWSPAALSAPPAGGPGGGTGAHAFDLGKSPVLSGKAKAGKKLRASAGTWSPAPSSVTYTWLRNGKVVAGRTGATYKLGKADRGKRIQVRVTVHRGGYADRSATSGVVKVRR
ncbi:hypothetical protein [Nocardioides daeguensis]|uniref:Ig-like domain-containing protein n=1 Tax=Nocardioides daeguensis TaxID=908359 RepID=A0ABP6VQ74_9ACTN|nr:hypothetical protein [Nocardioides daeguensis]MBV6728507.1 hypothetical protein [Nocardioides daeguensis]MCR1773931.1 hypothetical protein [Nocardioides daeguensis]